MTVIELGEVAHDSSGPALPVGYRRVPRVALTAVALAGTLVLTGSGHPAPPTVRPLWTAPLARDDSVHLYDRTAYVNRPAGNATELTAYDLATGRKKWRVVSGDTPTNFGVTAAFGVVLVPADPVEVQEVDGDQQYWTSFSRTTVALNAGDGRERWRTAGHLDTLGADGTGLVTEHDDHAVTTRMRLIRITDGHQIWDLPLSGVSAWTILWRDDQPSHLVTVTPGGDVRIFAYADGSLVTTGRVPWQHRESDVMNAGSHLAVRSNRFGPTTLYRPDDLTVLWTTGGSVSYLKECGPLLCALDGNGVSARDPATGREIWRNPDMFSVNDVAPGRLLMDSGGSGGVQQLADAETGRPIGERVYGSVLFGGPDGTMLLTRPTDELPGRHLVIQLDLTTGRQARLGVVELAEDRPCSLAGRYLGCPRDGTLTVTTVG
jgi:outer membrane protein assembly factor BamB